MHDRFIFAKMTDGWGDEIVTDTNELINSSYFCPHDLALNLEIHNPESNPSESKLLEFLT